MMKMKKSQIGSTLLEITLSLSLAGIMIAGLAKLSDRAIEDQKLATAADQMKQVALAADSYIKDNYTALLANATTTQPALITVPTLVAAGKLPTGFTTANTYGQNVCVLALEPTANSIRALVVAEGGTTLSDIDLAGVVSSMGAAGGAVYSTANTVVTGAQNGYSLPFATYGNANHLGKKCDGTTNGAVAIATGHNAFVLWFANGDSTASFLYRSAVAGRPELNQMQTNLDMNNFNITNAGTIALNTVVTAGSACTTNGTMARNSSGQVMACTSGTWQQVGGSAYWGDPAATYATLPTCNASNVNQTRIVTTPTTGTGPRAYTCNSSTWVAIAEDDNGNMVLDGAATANAFKVSGTTTLGASCTAADAGTISKEAAGGLLNCVKTGVSTYSYVRAGKSSTNLTSAVYRWEDMFQTTVGTNTYLSAGYVVPTGTTIISPGGPAGCPNYVREDIDVFQGTNYTAGSTGTTPNPIKLQQILCPYVTTGYPARSGALTVTDWVPFSDTTSTTPKTSYHGGTADRGKFIVFKFKRQVYDQFITMSANTQFMRGTTENGGGINLAYGDLANIMNGEYITVCGTNSLTTYQASGSRVGMNVATSCIAKIPKTGTSNPSTSYDYGIKMTFSTSGDTGGTFLRLSDPQDPLMTYTTTYSDDQ